MNLMLHLLYLLLQCIHFKHVKGQEIELNFCFNSSLEGNVYLVSFVFCIWCALDRVYIRPKTFSQFNLHAILVYCHTE